MCVCRGVAVRRKQRLAVLPAKIAVLPTAPAQQSPLSPATAPQLQGREPHCCFECLVLSFTPPLTPRAGLTSTRASAAQSGNYPHRTARVDSHPPTPRGTGQARACHLRMGPCASADYRRGCTALLCRVKGRNNGRGHTAQRQCTPPLATQACMAPLQ
ncbi:MAG: hypothetical protein J3K34DRAFT_422817 [Monoraphidium minutum]|nr:MAG: hypothetical protein J3K34DRAFT_422817 [Monoraphidium minutum]